MRWLPLPLLAGLVAAVFLSQQATQAQQESGDSKGSLSSAATATAPSFLEGVRPLLKAYCFECHNPNRRKGGLDLEKIDSAAAALSLVELWDQVGERLTSKEMPPAGKRQPTDEERAKVLAWVKHVAGSQVSCATLTKEQREKSLAGHALSRRLSRFEYNNTLRDLFGVDMHAGDLLPSEGGGGEGFDNAGATLFTTPVLMEKYLEAAEIVLSTILPSAASDKTASDKAQLGAVRRKLLIAQPGPDMPPRLAARKVLESFLPRAFRRPVAADEVERYLGLFDKAAQRGQAFEQSLKLALKGVLIAPSFLFLIQTPPEREGAFRLGHYEMASQLSYFLWAFGPRCRTKSCSGWRPRGGCTMTKSCADRSGACSAIRGPAAWPTASRPSGSAFVRSASRFGPTPGCFRNSTRSWPRPCARRPSSFSIPSSARIAAFWS
jgi:mono/diheme cytochrome c family protein